MFNLDGGATPSRPNLALRILSLSIYTFLRISLHPSILFLIPSLSLIPILITYQPPIPLATLTSLPPSSQPISNQAPSSNSSPTLGPQSSAQSEKSMSLSSDNHSTSSAMLAHFLIILSISAM